MKLNIFVLLFVCIFTQSVIGSITVERTFNHDYYIPGGQRIAVVLNLTGEADDVIITEIIPAGWNVFSAPNGLVNENTIQWEISEHSGSSQIRYFVNTPEIANGNALFSGMVNNIEIGGENELIYHVPTPGKQVTIFDSLYHYWLYLPSNYNNQQNQWPLIIFLYGGCAVGNDVELVLTHYDVSVLTILEDSSNAELLPELFNSIVVSPQSTTIGWDIHLLNDFLIELFSTYSIDPNRVYLYGHAMGADAGWALADEFPDMLAAFFCGGMMTTPPSVSPHMAGLPVWMCEFEKYKTIPYDHIQSCVDQLNTLGGECIYTFVPSSSTFTVRDLYYNPELYQWFMQQNKQTRLSETACWEMY